MQACPSHYRNLYQLKGLPEVVNQRQADGATGLDAEIEGEREKVWNQAFFSKGPGLVIGGPCICTIYYG